MRYENKIEKIKIVSWDMILQNAFSILILDLLFDLLLFLIYHYSLIYILFGAI